VRTCVEELETLTARVVGEFVDALRDLPDPAVAVYRTDEEFASDRPEAAYMPARWWQHVVVRSCAEVPGVIIDTTANLRTRARRTGRQDGTGRCGSNGYCVSNDGADRCAGTALAGTALRTLVPKAGAPAVLGAVTATGDGYARDDGIVATPIGVPGP
jgi:hypothetical protein